MLMSLMGSSSMAMKPGDFGARIAGDVLEIPKSLFDVLKRLELRTVDDFLSYVQTFPSAVAMPLKWRPDEVQEATKRLEAALAEASPGVNWSGSANSLRRFGARRR